MKKRLFLSAAFALLAFVVIELRYVRGTAGLFHPPRKPLTDADRDRARAGLPGLEEVSFRTSGGLVLSGFCVPSKNGAIVVMGHGLASNRMQLLADEEVLARHGYGSLSFDWRGHGESEGATSTWSDREQADFAAAVDFAAKRSDVKAGRIAGLGFSIGASTVALEAAGDARVRAVILEAIYPSFEEEIRSKMGQRGVLSLWPALLTVRYYGVDAGHIRPIDHVAEIAPRPALFIAGALDDDTPVSVVRRVYDAASEPKQIWVAAGAGHGGYTDVVPAEYERVLIAFLDAAFFGAHSP